jgi:hypothetical protein
METLQLAYFAIKIYSTGMISFILDPLVLIFFFIVFGQYKKVVVSQREIYGGSVRYSLKDLVSTAILVGIVAGFIGVIAITVLGITFYKFDGLQYLIFLSLLLMLVKPRYVCLSYSGGVLSLSVLIVTALVSGGNVDKGNPVIAFINNNLSFDVTALMALIAIMHLIEAILMWFDGHRGAIPVFMKRNGKVVGAFIMQRFWIIPIVFYIYTQGQSPVGNTVATPDWWPIIKPPISKELLKDAIFMALPLVPAILGYGDFAVTTPVKAKVKRSAVNLLMFSITLLILSFISVKIYAFKYIAVLFAPLAHEGMILYERYRENKGKPIWESSEDGIIIIDTVPGGPADAMKIQSGDKIKKINNIEVYTLEDMETVFSQFITFIWIEVEGVNGERRVVEHKNYADGIQNLGIITVPKNDYDVPILEESEGFLIRKIKGIFNK